VRAPTKFETARSVEAGDEAICHRVLAGYEDNWMVWVAVLAACAAGVLPTITAT
jgi:hypothetical protein